MRGCESKGENRAGFQTLFTWTASVFGEWMLFWNKKTGLEMSNSMQGWSENRGCMQSKQWYACKNRAPFWEVVCCLCVVCTYAFQKQPQINTTKTTMASKKWRHKEYKIRKWTRERKMCFRCRTMNGWNSVHICVCVYWKFIAANLVLSLTNGSSYEKCWIYLSVRAQPLVALMILDLHHRGISYECKRANDKKNSDDDYPSSFDFFVFARVCVRACVYLFHVGFSLVCL